MPTAHMYRACCTRLESCVKPLCVKRAIFFALRQNLPRTGSIATRRYHAASQPQPSTPNDRFEITPQLRTKGAWSKTPEPHLEFESEEHQQHVKTLLTLEADLNVEEEIKKRRNTKTPAKKNNPSNVRRGRASQPKTSPRPNVFSKGSNKSKKGWQDQIIDYQQWGYIRHQYPPEERLPARRSFAVWKRKLYNVMDPKNPESWPWRNDGEFIYKHEDIADMKAAWEELDVETRTHMWPTVMLSTLHNCPNKTGQVLEVTLDPLPPGYAISDTLFYYIKTVRFEDIKNARDRTSKADEIMELVSKIIMDLPPKHAPLRQHTLGFLAKKLPTEQVAEMYQILHQANIKLHQNTLLQYASTLAKSSPHKEMAYEILRGIAADGINLNRSSVASVITTLLHSRDAPESWSKADEVSFSPQRAMEFFLEKGYSPNLISFTALVDSLCSQGDIAEAIRLPLLLAENGADLDVQCYTTVFRGAKHSLKASNVLQALDVAKAAKAPYVDVLNNTLHSVFYFAEMECREKKYPAPWTLPLFAPMLGIYAKKFDLEPLQWLVPDILPLILEQGGEDGPEKFRLGSNREWEFKHTILPVAKEFFDSGDGTKQTPNSATLAIMLRAYVKSLSSPYDIMSFYSFFKTRLEEPNAGKNWAVELIKEQGSVLHDTLILSMLEQRSLLRPALQVFGDMLRDSIKAKANETDRDEQANTEAPPVHPAPNMFTFSILIHGLMVRGQKMLAEQVLQVMREHNLEPNIVTWNTLVKGYAAMQNLSQTVGTLQDLEAAGFQPDVYTYRAFARLKDQTRALQTMEKIIDANKKRLEQNHSLENM